MAGALKTLPDTLVLPGRTVSRSGAHLDILSEGRGLGSRCFLVHGAAAEIAGLARRMTSAAPCGMAVGAWRHRGGEPTLSDVEAALREARRFAPDWIAAVGGGSVLDVAKACAGLFHADRPVRDYHDGAPLPDRVLPYIAVPTTAGTGSEATVVTVLTNGETGVKKSFRHPDLMARVVVLAPELLATCPPHAMAASGMDAFVQAIEAFTSRGATRLTDMLAGEGLRLVDLSIEKCCSGNAGMGELADMLQGSYLTGCALSNARLGLVHGLAHPLGARFGAAHGLVCAVCLPDVLEFNRQAISEKYEQLARILDRDPIERTTGLMASLGIVSPFAGKELRDTDAVVDEVMASGSTAANPRPVTRDDVRVLLAALFAEGRWQQGRRRWGDSE
jgi:alcohol dehydrogenase class IV